MNKLEKVYKAKRRKALQNKIFNVIMLATILFMLAFSVQMCRRANELQTELNITK